MVFDHYHRVGGAPRQLIKVAEESDLPVRLANPGTPTPVLVGPATETLSQLRRFRSDFNSVTYSWRMRFTATTANGWVYYTVPQIAGFQFPLILSADVYQQTGGQDATEIQNADMNNTGNDWADIGRVYIGQNSGKDTEETKWLNLKVQYIKS